MVEAGFWQQPGRGKKWKYLQLGGRAKLRTYIFDSDDRLRSRCSVGSDSAMS